MSENTFTVTEQLERELLWDALESYKESGLANDNEEARLAVDAMIQRVSQTFSWNRDYCKVQLGKGILCHATMVNGKCSDGHA